jgi:hypothetical protein
MAKLETETKVAARMLNRMLKLRQLSYIRIS